MTPAVFALAVISILVILVDIAFIMCWLLRTKNNYHKDTEYRPKVSVLLAARNEAQNINRCLKALLHLDYPNDKLEILIGDDDSEDNTFEIADTIAQKYNHVHLYSIKEDLGQAKGKANVLAHLARKAEGDIFFITDADIAVPPSWIKGMLTGYDPKIGIVSGITAVEGNALHNIEWLFVFGMIKISTDLGRPVTAIGNNMFVTRQAYQDVGGYENIPFSVTEDFELFKQVRNKNYEVVQRFDERVLAYTRPISGYLNLLKQRKRWMTGVLRLPLSVIAALALQGVYYPAIIILLVVDIKLGLTLFLLKSFFQSTLIATLQHKLRQPVNIFSLIIFDLYSALISLSSALYYLLPGKIIWKGRKY